MTPSQQRRINQIQQHVANTNGRWNIEVSEQDHGTVEAYLTSTKFYDNPIQFFIGTKGGTKIYRDAKIERIRLHTLLTVYVRPNS